MYSLNIYTSSNSVSENLCNIWSLILRSGKYNNSDWSKAHVIYNSLFDWIWLWIMCALYQSESTSQIWENLLGLCMWGLFYTGVYAWEGESRGPWTSQSAFLCLLGAGIPDIVVNINELCLKNASQWWILWIFIIRLFLFMLMTDSVCDSFIHCINYFSVDLIKRWKDYLYSSHHDCFIFTLR